MKDTNGPALRFFSASMFATLEKRIRIRWEKRGKKKAARPEHAGKKGKKKEVMEKTTKTYSGGNDLLKEKFLREKNRVEKSL